MESDSNQPSAESKKLAALRQMVYNNATKQELLRCLSDGLWHNTSELARFAQKTNPVIGLVTVGTILNRMQNQLGEHFLEHMVQHPEHGVASWRIGVEWLDIVNEVLRENTGSQQ